jgi:hypothetical protein
MSSTNIFAALQKKKSVKKPAKDAALADEEPKVDKNAELEKAIFSVPTGGMGNWADESEDEEWDGHPAAAELEEGWAQVRLTRNPIHPTASYPHTSLPFPHPHRPPRAV